MIKMADMPTLGENSPKDFSRTNQSMLFSLGILGLQTNDDVKVSNSYTMGCPPVRGDNPRALASGLSYV